MSCKKKVKIWLKILNSFCDWSSSFLSLPSYHALQIKGRWESNINVWFKFMYSQTLNCAASLFLKQSYNLRSVSQFPHFMYSICERFMYSEDHSQIHKYRNWERGRPLSFLGIHKSNFRNSVYEDLGKLAYFWDPILNISQLLPCGNNGFDFRKGHVRPWRHWWGWREAGLHVWPWWKLNPMSYAGLGLHF